MSNLVIYFGQKPVFLTSEVTPEIDEYRHHPDAVFIDELSTAAINSLLHEIHKPEFHAGIIFHEDFPQLKKAFFKHFLLIKAGGGIVKNSKGELLMIFRRGKWDLPKGKLDEGETIEECAIREVQEETGLKELKMQELKGISYHAYEEFGKYILKESHWYEMKAKGNEKPVPQTEEDITEIVWAKREKLPEYISNTFPAIERLLSDYL